MLVVVVVVAVAFVFGMKVVKLDNFVDFVISVVISSKFSVAIIPLNSADRREDGAVEIVEKSVFVSGLLASLFVDKPRLFDV